MVEPLEVIIVGNAKFWEIYSVACQWREKLSQSTGRIEELIKWTYLCNKDLSFIAESVAMFGSDHQNLLHAFNNPKQQITEEIV